MHTISICNGIRLLLYFGLGHNSMTLDQTSIKRPKKKSQLDVYSAIIPYSDKVKLATYLADFYIALINLGMVDCNLSRTYLRLIESCADMAKLAPKVT